MPEFILDHGTADAARKFFELDEFTRGYIEAAFFTNTGSGDDGDLEDASFSELSPESLKAASDDCERFNLAADAWLFKAYTRGDMSYSSEQAGRDFWFTRCGHGVGFCDRDLGVTGDKLSEIARTFGNVDMYRGDDGLIYFS